MRERDRDPTLKKMIHGFFGLSETVLVHHRGAEFRIRFSRPSTDPVAIVAAEILGNRRIRATRSVADPVWTIVDHGSEVMYFRTAYNERLARAEIVLMADRSWRFSWETHTTTGVPVKELRR